MRTRTIIVLAIILMLPTLSYRFIEECPKLEKEQDQDACYFDVAPFLATNMPLEGRAACDMIRAELRKEMCYANLVDKYIIQQNKTMALEMCAALAAENRLTCFDSISPYFKDTSAQFTLLSYKDPRIIYFGALAIPGLIVLGLAVYGIHRWRKSLDTTEQEAQRKEKYSQEMPPEEGQGGWYEGGSLGDQRNVSFIVEGDVQDTTHVEGFQY